jgi:TonB family protein
VNAGLLKTTWLSRPQKVGTQLASAFALAMFAVTAPFAQGQAPSPQGTPSSEPEPALQISSGAETTPSVHVAGIQAQANLIHQVAPVYPQPAKSAHVSGTVLLHCIIGKDGTVQYVQYVSGPPLLMKSAMDAVRQWKYKPTIINGKDVQVDATVSVAFTLGGSSVADTSQAIESRPVDRYKPNGYINDFAGVIDSRDKSRLDLICKDLDQKTEIQMAIVTIESLEGQPIKNFAADLGNLWGVGHKGGNRGLLILIAVEDRQYRIAVGLGLEPVLTDEEADRLGREMVPMLKNGDYGKALLQLAKRIQSETAQRVE